MIWRSQWKKNKELDLPTTCSNMDSSHILEKTNKPSYPGKTNSKFKGTKVSM